MLHLFAVIYFSVKDVLVHVQTSKLMEGGTCSRPPSFSVQKECLLQWNSVFAWPNMLWCFDIKRASTQDNSTFCHTISTSFERLKEHTIGQMAFN